MKETKTLEYKEKITNTFLKTVSAYANYETGVIKFGITDSGEVVGVTDPKETCLNIENKINDSIDPRPNFELTLEAHNVIALKVFEGLEKPYLYKGKAYKRNDTATIEVSRGELNRLTLQGMEKTFDEQLTSTKELHFTALEKELQDKLGIKKLTPDILKTLDLLSPAGYNHAAELLADENDFSGVDLVRFGKSIDEIMERKTFRQRSLLLQFRGALKQYRKYYEYEQISGTTRKKVQLIPEVAFREALANALVHRAWDVSANILISMYADRIELRSPGGLPFGVTKDEYLRGYISVPRNPIVANLFFRLKYIEMFGTGILRIKNAYVDEFVQPSFQVLPNAVMITLPVLHAKTELSKDELLVLEQFETGGLLSKRELVTLTGLSSSKLSRLLAKLVSDHRLTRIGAGRATKYQR